MATLAQRRSARPRAADAWVGWTVTGALVVLVALPLGALLLHLAFPRLYLGDPSLGDFALFRDLWQRRVWRVAVVNSLTLASGAMVLGTLIGAGMAYLRHNFRFPGAALIDVAAWFVLVMPSFIIAQGWVLFARSNGLAAQFGLPWVNDFVFSTQGLVVVMSLTNFPLAYLATSAALSWNVRNLEHAARLGGATAWQAFWTIRLPLLVPALISAALLVFIDTIGDFGLPAAFLSVFRYPLITYMIRAEIQTIPVSFEGAAVLSGVLVAIVGLAIALQLRVLRGSGYDFLTGGAQPTDRPMPRFWPLLTAITAVFLFLAVVAPLGTSLSVSFMERYSQGFAWSNLTLANYQDVLSEGSAWIAAIRHSYVIAFTAAAIALTVGFLGAYLLVFSEHRMRRFIDVASTVTLAVPGIVLAVGYIFWWNQRWLAELGIQVYGSPWAIILCSAAASVPIAVRVILGAMAQLPPSFIASAALQGAGFAARLRTILAPLLVGALLSAGLAVLASSVFDLSITIMLQPPNYPTIPVVIDERFRTVEYGWATAATVLVCLITAALIVAIRTAVRWLFRDYLAATESARHDR